MASSELIDRQRQRLKADGTPEDSIRVVVSPYRICPIGAHSDHQYGPVLGMAVSEHTVLAFAPSDRTELRLTSGNYPGEVRIDLNRPSKHLKASPPDWGRYAQGAVWSLLDRLPENPRGIVGRVTGTLPGGGLSSSASVLLAYLWALADANDLSLQPEDAVAAALRAERDFVGVAVGALDPAAIVGSRKGHLLSIETRSIRWEALRLGPAAPDHRILVVFTGMARNLAGTGYNRRVEECYSAARRLALLTGKADARVLGDFSDADFENHSAGLPADERRRARHFFTERARVSHGAELWRQGDLEAFGRLMNASCESSIHDYQTGSRELIELQQILVKTPGVFGSRFSGGGFGGSAVALVSADRAEDIRASVEDAFQSRFPRLAERARAFLVDSEDGIRML